MTMVDPQILASVTKGSIPDGRSAKQKTGSSMQTRTSKSLSPSATNAADLRDD